MCRRWTTLWWCNGSLAGWFRISKGHTCLRLPVSAKQQSLTCSDPKGFPKLPVPELHNKDYSILGSILGSPYLGKYDNVP